MNFFFTGNGMKFGHWYRNEAELRRYYSTTWLLLPLGSIFITALVVLVMILFNRCPQLITAFITGILGIMIIFMILLSLHQNPTYV